MIYLQVMSGLGDRDPRHLPVPPEYTRPERKPRDWRHHRCLKPTGLHQLPQAVLYEHAMSRRLSIRIECCDCQDSHATTSHAKPRAGERRTLSEFLPVMCLVQARPFLLRWLAVTPAIASIALM